MKYLKATADAFDYFTGYALVEGELVTQKQRNTRFRYISDDYFTPVEIPKNKTFTSFGCRFEMMEEV